MTDKDRLNPFMIRTQCAEVKHAASTDINDLNNIQDNINNFVNDTEIESISFDHLKMQFDSYNDVISMMVAANNVLIADCSSLEQSVGNEILDGDQILKQKEKNRKLRDAMYGMARHYKAQAIVFPLMAALYLSLAALYNKLGNFYDSQYQYWYAKELAFDAIEAATANLFTGIGTTVADIMTMLNELLSSYVLGQGYLPYVNSQTTVAEEDVDIDIDANAVAAGAPFDQGVYDQLIAAGWSDHDAQRVAYVYAAVEPLYGHKAALCVAACSLCEGSAGQFEGLSWYIDNRKEYNSKGDRVNPSYPGLYDMAHDTNVCNDSDGVVTDQEKAIEIFRRLGGNTISSAQDATDWKFACDVLKGYCGYSGGQGIGFIQFSGERRDSLLALYENATDFSDGGRWGIEATYLVNEAENNSTYANALNNASQSDDYASAVSEVYRGLVSGGSNLNNESDRVGKMEALVNVLGF